MSQKKIRKYGRNVKFSKVIVCKNGCCKVQIEPFTWKKDWTSSENNTERKAGIFIYDSLSNKILLVQSCGFLWGPPKGSVRKNETIQEAAIREVKEETGIDVTPEQLEKVHNLKKKSYYYTLDMRECAVDIKNNKNNDANGITWIKIGCLTTLCNNKGTYKMTRHAKIMIKKVFGIDIINKSHSMPLLKTIPDTIKKEMNIKN